MKYAQAVIGLLIGTALGGSVVAASSVPEAGAGLDKEAVKEIVRETLREEPQLIIDSVQNWQNKARQEQQAGTSAKLKDPQLQKEIYASPDSPFIGPASAEQVIVEFFDYNCPACKMMFESLDTVLGENKNVKVIFKEFPIFGPSSETNAKIGIAVHRVDTKKYFDFHRRMMQHKGRADEATALKIVRELGMDADAVKAEAASPEVAAILQAEHALAGKLNLSGTPTLIVNGELVPHAMSAEDLKARLAKE